MTPFKTSDGIEWRIDVNVLTVKRCMDETGLKLTDLFADETALAKFFADDLTFCLVLASVVRPQLASAGKSTDDFLAAIDGTVIEQAAKALIRETAGFFQEPRKGLLLKMLQKWEDASEKVQNENLDEVQKKLDEVNFEQMIRSQFAPTSSALSSPGSAE
jgi:hypothetical protein